MFSRVISDICASYVDPESRNNTLLADELAESLDKQGFTGIATAAELSGLTSQQASELIMERAWKAYDQKVAPVMDRVRQYEKDVSLNVIDRAWVNHIDTMSKLRDGIGLRSYAQDNPLQAYVTEGYQMFENMMHDIAQEIVRYCMNLKVVVN